MKLFALALAVGFFSPAEAAFNTIERPFECPLRVQRPTLGNPGYDLQIEALTFFLEQKAPGVCTVWLQKVRALRDALVAFHEKTIDPLPQDFVKEAHGLSQQVAKLLVESATALAQGKSPCGSGRLTEQSREALAALVRTLYASNDSFRQLGTMAGGILQVTKSFEEAVAETMKSVREQLEFNEKKAKQRADAFVQTACEWLETEHQVRCKKQAPPTDYADKLVKVRKAIGEQVQVAASASREFLKTQNVFDRLRSFMSSKRSVAGEDAFYHYVVPSLRMCELEQAIQGHDKDVPENQTREFVERCGHLLCDNVGMLPKAGSPLVQRRNFEDAFCDFAGDYRRVEGKYKQAFDEFVTHTPTGTQVARATRFCPTEGAITNLPAVDDSQKPRANPPDHGSRLLPRVLR